MDADEELLDYEEDLIEGEHHLDEFGDPANELPDVTVVEGAPPGEQQWYQGNAAVWTRLCP